MMPLDYSFLHIGLFIIVFAISFINKKPNINIYYSYPCRLLIIYNLLSLGGILFIHGLYFANNKYIICHFCIAIFIKNGRCKIKEIYAIKFMINK